MHDKRQCCAWMRVTEMNIEYKLATSTCYWSDIGFWVLYGPLAQWWRRYVDSLTTYGLHHQCYGTDPALSERHNVRNMTILHCCRTCWWKCMNTNTGDGSGVFLHTSGCFRSEGKSPTKLWEETNGKAKEIGFFSQCSTPRTGSQTTAC